MAKARKSADEQLDETNPHDQPLDAFAERDWCVEDDLQFPARTQIRKWVREEFLNRWRNFGLQYTHLAPGAENYAAGESTQYNAHTKQFGYDAVASQNAEHLAEWDQNIYKGPKTAWGTVVSSAIVEDPDDPDKDYQGFVLGGNGNFHDTYGFDSGDGVNGGGGEAKTLLGYDLSKQPRRHEIDERSYKFRPSPGITSIESEDIEPGKNFRKTTVSFTCWSQDQLDYLQPYFFQPGMTAIVEWGWNTFPRDSLITRCADDYKRVHRLWNNEKSNFRSNLVPNPSPVSEHLRRGCGNYGFAMGLITNFNYSMRDDGGYDCSIQISCMSEVGQQIMTSGAVDKQKEDSKFVDIKTFINKTLRRSLLGKYDIGSTMNEGLSPTEQKLKEEIRGSADDKVVKAAEEEAYKLARGRYFSFNMYDSSKPFMAGKSNANGGTYITVGYLIDIFNMFFARKSEGNMTNISHFTVYGCRCVAHPNIKSVDGSVLLIPNSVAPRWNTETFNGSTIAKTKSTGAHSARPAGYSVLKKGEAGGAKQCYKDTSQAFIDIVKAMNPGKSPPATIEEALKMSPRDDLYQILSVKATSGYNLQHPAISNKFDENLKEAVALSHGQKKIDRLKEAWVEANDCVRPFPDFASDTEEGPGITGNTMGYSGRIEDLYVNLDVITDSFNHGENASAILLDIMRKVSAAAGNIWKFAIIGRDLSTSSNIALALVDQNFSGSETVGQQKANAWVFPSHRGDSMVRELDLSVEPTSEMASMIVFGNLDKKNGFFAKEDHDLILKGAKNPLEGAVANLKDVDKHPTNIEDPEKYIVTASSKFFGVDATSASFPSYPVDKDLGQWDISYTDKDGKKKTLKADNEEDRDKNIDEIKKDKDKDESSIKTGSKRNKTKKQSYGSSVGPGDISRKRTFQIKADYDFVNKVAKKEGLEGSTNDMVWKHSSDMVNDDMDHERVRKRPTLHLVGKVIHFGTYTSGWNDVWKEPNQQDWPDDDKNYKIVSVTWHPTYKDPDTWFGSEIKEKTGYPYEVHLEELPGQETALHPSALQAYHNAKEKHGDDFDPNNSEHLDPKVAKYIKENNLSEEYLDKQDILTYKSNSNLNKKMSVSRANVKIHDDGYGTDKNDYEINIELVDIDRNRMKNFCELDPSPKNNIINNMPLPGVELTLKLDGIEGLRLYDTFNCAGIPKKYYEKGIFAITGVKHSIGDGDWSTTIESHYYPGVE